eukprot:Gregarina_sp_Poly_1__5796@NODE_304_length_9736_cov_136_409039_g263_i0_p4_GENE_NODE_304_length_9736_cov_136_409039_g263_i0NODE_304_length_9736_cov_136_409039_g263_i0_p4_ORF_typecomplete_len363_score64_77_NODE_304_length_9736_cov_136_409039_g263_i064867574
MSEQNAFGKRTKNSIETVLQNYKKCKLEKETRTWDWAAKELVATANLQEGSKIYVKFDVETTFTPDENDDDIADGKLDATELTVSIEESDNDCDEMSSRIEKDETGKTIRVINEQVVWWPAIVKRSATTACSSLRDTWKTLLESDSASGQITPSMRKELGDLVSERGDAPIWSVRYEPREDFDKEDDLEWSAFFADSSTLVHLEKGRVCIAPYKKALDDGSCPEDLGLSQGPDVCALDALTAAIGVMESSVLTEISVSDPEESGQITRNSAEFAGKFGGLLKGFFKEMSRTSDRVVTPGDVWKFFDKFLSTSAAETTVEDNSSSAPTQHPTRNTETASTDPPSGVSKDELEEAPFPRLPDSP